MWKNAHRSVPLEMSPSEFGWVLKDCPYRMNWYAGEQMPDDVESAIDESTDNVDSDEDIYSSAYLIKTMRLFLIKTIS